jgi:RecA/RadA recombinase
MAARKKTTKKTNKKAPKKAAAKKAPAKKLTPQATVAGGTPPPVPTAPPPPASADAAERRAMLDAIASQFNEDGHLVVVRGDEAPNPYIIRRPTGIMELDIDLGGGFPAGGTCFVSGPDNCGKTWLMMHVMAMQQKLYGEDSSLVMAITEGGFPYDQAMRVGLRVAVPDAMILQWQQARTQRGFPPYSATDIAYFKEQVGDFRIIRGSTGEEVLDIILAIMRARACSVVCVDSLQGLEPAADAGKDMDENDKMAAHATMMGKFFKKYIPLTTGLNGVNETTLLMTQQVRSNKAKTEAKANVQKYLKDWAITGAYSSKHFKLVDLVLYDGAKERGKDSEGRSTSVVRSKTLHWETEKGKAGTHDNIVGSVKYSYEISQGVDFIGTVIDSAQRRGVLRKVGSKYTLVRPEDNVMLQQYEAPSLKAFRRCMELDPEFEMAVRLEVLAAAGKTCLYR